MDKNIMWRSVFFSFYASTIIAANAALIMSMKDDGALYPETASNFAKLEAWCLALLELLFETLHNVRCCSSSSTGFVLLLLFSSLNRRCSSRTIVVCSARILLLYEVSIPRMQWSSWFHGKDSDCDFFSALAFCLSMRSRSSRCASCTCQGVGK